MNARPARVSGETAPEHEERSYDVRLGEGQHVRLVVEPGQGLAARAAPPPPAPPRRSGGQLAGFMLGGIGIAGLGVGAVTGILAIVKKGEVIDACPNLSRCTVDAVRLEGTGKALAAVSTLSFVLGLAGVGAGLTVVLLSRDEPRSPEAALQAAVLPGGGAVGVGGSF